MAAAKTTPAGPDDSGGLGQRAHAIRALTQMVERSQEQHGVDGGVIQVDLAGVADPRRDLVHAQRPQLVHVQAHQVAVLDPVAETGQPDRVTAWPATDVGDHRGNGR